MTYWDRLPTCNCIARVKLRPCSTRILFEADSRFLSLAKATAFDLLPAVRSNIPLGCH